MGVVLTVTGPSNRNSLRKIKGYLECWIRHKRQAKIFTADMQSFTGIEHTAFKHAFFTDRSPQMHHIINRCGECRLKLSIVEIETGVNIDTAVIPVDRQSADQRIATQVGDGNHKGFFRIPHSREIIAVVAVATEITRQGMFAVIGLGKKRLSANLLT